MKIHNNNYLYDCYAWTALSRNNYNVTITDWKILEYAWYCLKKKESQIESCPLCGNFVWSINYMYAVVDNILLYHFNLALKATKQKHTFQKLKWRNTLLSSNFVSMYFVVVSSSKEVFITSVVNCVWWCI